MKEKMNVLYRKDTRKPASEYSRKQAASNNQCGRLLSIVGDKNHWCAHLDQYTLTVQGPRQYWKRTSTYACTYKDRKLYGNIDMFKEGLCEIFHLDWILTNMWTLDILKSRKDLWVACLNNKITSPEKLCKYVSKKYFKGAYSYAILRRAVEEHFCGVSLWDLVDYTTNPEIALKILLDRRREGESYYTIQDVIQNCRILNTKMNPMWSEKRLHDEHQKQIEEINLMEIESFSDTSVLPAFSYGGLSLITNERECYKEGCTMHNCVHSCYWRRIKNGQYLIAKGSVNGEYIDLGISVYTHSVELDQVHSSYNRCVSEETRKYCQQWINILSQELLAVANSVREIKKLEPQVIDDYPF